MATPWCGRREPPRRRRSGTVSSRAPAPVFAEITLFPGVLRVLKPPSLMRGGGVVLAFMTITQNKLDLATVLQMNGRLDSITAQAAQDQFVSCIKCGERHLVLDCAGLDYISSAGLRALLVAAKQLKPLGGKIVLCSPSDYVREIIELAGFDAFIGLSCNCEQALKSLRPAA